MDTLNQSSAPILDPCFEKDPSTTDNEQGMVLLLFVAILLAAIGIVAMVIDHSKQTLALNNLQNAADSAALSGVRRLNGREKGWEDAKLAAVLVLKQSDLHGIKKPGLGSLILTEGNAYPNSGVLHTGQKGSAGGIEVIVRRGSFWWDPNANGGQGGHSFISLEDDSKGAKFWAPVHTIANAVEVSLRIKSFASTVGRVLGMNSFKNLVRSAVAVSERNLQFSVHPFAIPLCQLLQNTSPYMTAETVSLKEFNAGEQCKREIIITDADPDGTIPDLLESGENQNARQERREGLVRFRSHVRPPYYTYEHGGGLCFNDDRTGEFHGCTYPTLYGVLGTPTTTAGTKATVADIAAFMKTGGETSLGMYFAPLEDITEFNFNESARSALGEFINASGNSRTISSTFMNGGAPRDNFPFVRNQRPPIPDNPECDESDRFATDSEGRPCFQDGDLATNASNTPSEDKFYDLRIGWPTRRDGNTYQEKMLMDRKESDGIKREPMNYSNPLCHDDSVQIDEPSAPVRRVLAMVIAPEVTKRPNTNEDVKYCDFENMFLNRNRQRSVAPVAKSHPKIVGFVWLNAFDGNLTYLPTLFTKKPIVGNPFIAQAPSVTPEYPIASATKDLVDRNPGQLDVRDPDNPLWENARKDAKKYANQFDSWNACVDEDDDKHKKKKCDQPDKPRLKPEDVEDRFLGIPTSFLRCFKLEAFVGEFGHIIDKMTGIEFRQDGFYPDEDPDDGIPPEPRYCYIDDDTGECLPDSVTSEMIGTLQSFLDSNVDSTDWMHCLPMLRSGYYDWKDPDHYEPELRSLKASFGCGGVRARLDCLAHTTNNPWVFATGKRWDQANPSLVKSSK